MRSFSLVVLTLCGLLFAGCYRMPEDDYISTIPVTNNPQMVPQRGGANMPGMKY